MLKIHIVIGLLGLLVLPISSALADEVQTLATVCVSVRSHSLFKGGDEGNSMTQPACKTELLSDKASSPMGDVIVGVTDDSANKMDSYATAHSGRLVLYLNGVALEKDATLQSNIKIGDKAVVYYRFGLKTGDETRRLRDMLYHDAGLTQPALLSATILWIPENLSSQNRVVGLSDASFTKVQIATPMQLLLAALLVAVLLIFVIYLGRRTEIFRDAGGKIISEWWAEARELQNEYSSIDTEDEKLIFIKKSFTWYTSDQMGDCKKIAAATLSGGIISEEDMPKVQVGLILGATKWKAVRASYSLSRIQLGLWFTFTVAVGLFFWLIYGELQAIPGSMLMLLGISVAGSSFSWMVDKDADAEDRSYTFSRGLLYDITTGFDDRRQLHRYQAVVVNILLLVVGISLVVQQLTWPTFDPSWLYLLGISSATQGIGKQLIENKS